MAKVKTTCAKCGKEFEADEKLINWMDNVKGERICSECFAKAKSSTGKNEKTKSATPNKTAKPSTDISPEEFRKVYDEFVASFADIIDDVKPLLGGWVSTVLINRHKKF